VNIDNNKLKTLLDVGILIRSVAF